MENHFSLSCFFQHFSFFFNRSFSNPLDFIKIDSFTFQFDVTLTLKYPLLLLLFALILVSWANLNGCWSNFVNLFSAFRVLQKQLGQKRLKTTVDKFLLLIYTHTHTCPAPHWLGPCHRTSPPLTLPHCSLMPQWLLVILITLLFL